MKTTLPTRRNMLIGASFLTKRLALFWVLLWGAMCAQNLPQVKVLDFDTQSPIPDVRIHSYQPHNLIEKEQDFLAGTNANGKFTLNRGWTDKDLYHFEHPDYEALSLSMREIRDKGYRVFMRKKAEPQNQSQLLLPEQYTELASPQVLESRVLDRFPAVSLGEYFRSGMQVYAPSSLPGGGELLLLGLGRNTMQIDGMRLIPPNSGPAQARNNPGPAPWHFETAEIWTGPRSVMSGSEAMGGSFNLLTSSLWNRAKGQGSFSGKVATGYENAYGRNWGGLQLKYQSHKVSGFTSAFGVRNQSLRQGEGINHSAAWQSLQVLQKLKFRSEKLNASHQFTFYFNGVPQLEYTARTEALLPDPLGPDRWEKQSHALFAYRMQISRLFNDFFDRAELRVVGQNSRRQGVYVETNGREIQREQQLGLDIEARFIKAIREKSVFRYGLGLSQDRGRGEAFSFKDEKEFGVRTLPSLPDGGAVLTRTYAWIQQTYRFRGPWTGDWGLRFTHQGTRAQYEEVGDLSWLPNTYQKGGNALGWHARLGFHPKGYFAYSLGFAGGFRFVSAQELGWVYQSAPGQAIAPNELLQAEQNRLLDLKVKVRFLPNLLLKAQAYYQAYRKGLTLAPDSWLGQDSLWVGGVWSRIYSLSNRGKADILGYRVHARWDALPGLRAELDLGGGYGLASGSRAAWANAPGTFGRMGLIYRNNGFQAGVATRFATAFASAKAWNALDLRLLYAFGSGLLLQVQVENLLDRSYQLGGSALPEVGRNLGASLVLRW